MRIGTWNLNVRWTEEHRDLLLQERCDIWLLTELPSKAVDSTEWISEYHCHSSAGVMDRKQHWAAVLSLVTARPLADPHPASATVLVDGVTFCSSILPWRNCGNELPWIGDSHSDRVKNAVEFLTNGLPKSDLVWGGDWNQTLVGGQSVGSKAGREYLTTALKVLGLKVPTAELLHQLGNGCHSIDHIAIPSAWSIIGNPRRIEAKRLSDHDAYVIEVVLPPVSSQSITNQ